MESVTEESIMCIKDEIYDLISSTNIETIAEPIDCHIIGAHGIKHEILKFSQVGRREEVCFVHTSIMAQIWGIFNRYCATLPTGFFSLLKRHTVVDTYRCVVVSEANPMQFAP